MGVVSPSRRARSRLKGNSSSTAGSAENVGTGPCGVVVRVQNKGRVVSTEDTTRPFSACDYLARLACWSSRVSFDGLRTR